MLLGNFELSKKNEYINSEDELVFNNKKLNTNEKIYQDIAIFVGNYENDFSDKLEKSIKILPLLSLEYMKINSLYPEVSKIILDNKNQIDEVVEDINIFKTQTSKIFAGVATIIGVDGAIDGTINLSIRSKVRGTLHLLS